MKPDQHIIDNLRASVNKHLDKAIEEEDYNGVEILEIAPDEHRSAKQEFRFGNVTTLNIVKGEDIEADICGLIPVHDNKYDAVICFEVLEHTSNPFLAIRELRRVLKKGGRLYLTTPFMFRIHNPLPDNWRFTNHGLNELLKDFREIEIIWEGEKLSPLHYRTIAKK